MLLVKTYLSKSEIEGIGLFAAEDIKKGTTIWKFQDKFDITATKEEINNLPLQAKEQFTKYSYFNNKINKYVFCYDDGRFMNHSDYPNTAEIDDPDSENETITIANQDIKHGEELTCNYNLFDGEAKNKLN